MNKFNKSEVRVRFYIVDLMIKNQNFRDKDI